MTQKAGSTVFDRRSVGFVAIRDILPGEEVVIDYGQEYVERSLPEHYLEHYFKWRERYDGRQPIVSVRPFRKMTGTTKRLRTTMSPRENAPAPNQRSRDRIASETGRTVANDTHETIRDPQRSTTQEVTVDNAAQAEVAIEGTSAVRQEHILTAEEQAFRSLIKKWVNNAQKGRLREMQSMQAQLDNPNHVRYDRNGRPAYTALFAATTRGHVDVVAWLLEMDGTQVDVGFPRLHQTPLLEAALQGTSKHTTIAKMLLVGKADPNARGRAKRGEWKGRTSWTPLHLSSAAGNVELSNVLISAKAGVDTTINSKIGTTPLWLASSNGQCDIIRLLLKTKADLFVRGKSFTGKKTTPLEEAVYKKYRHGTMPIFLLKRAIAIVHRDIGDRTSRLNTRIRKGTRMLHKQIQIHRMVSSCNLHQCIKRLSLPQSVSMKQTILRRMGKLLENGVESSSTKGKLTPLMAASRSAQHEATVLLLNANANVNARDGSNCTPLMHALSMVKLCGGMGDALTNQYTATVHVLIDARADSGITTTRGHTALSLAEKLGGIWRTLVTRPGSRDQSRMEDPARGAQERAAKRQDIGSSSATPAPGHADRQAFEEGELVEFELRNGYWRPAKILEVCRGDGELRYRLSVTIRAGEVQNHPNVLFSRVRRRQT